MKIPRRAFLKTSGVSLALPLLEAHGQLEAPPKRALFICNTLGFYSPAFYPKTAGAGYEPGTYLAQLQKHRADFTVYSGLSHPDQGGEHACEMTWLSAARNPGTDGFKNSISVDQFAARRLGHATRFPSLSLSSEGPMSQSYTGSGVMIPAMHRPSRVFARLFLQGRPQEIERERQRLREGKSILDRLAEHRSRVLKKASATDRARLEEYFESVREAERDLSAAEAWLERPKPKVNAEAPSDVPDKTDLVGRIRLLFNLVPLILQTDSTRVVSIVIQNHHGVPQIDGVQAEHHNLSHHGRDEQKVAQLMRIETEIMSCFDGLLAGLKGKGEGQGRLLDHTLTLFGSNLGNAAAHDPRNNPVILAGGGFDHGRYVRHDAQNNTPLSNLYVRVLQALGIETDRFATSSGILEI